MEDIDLTFEIANLLSRALAVVQSFSLDFNFIFSLTDFEKITKKIKEDFLRNHNKSSKALIKYIEKKISESEQSTHQSKYIVCYKLSSLIDNLIKYDDNDDKKYFYFGDRIPLSKNRPVICKEPLNSNYEETGIEIHPRGPVIKLSDWHQYDDGGKWEKRAFSNRDAFDGMNGQLHNIYYTEHTGYIHITDVIIDFSNSFNGDFIRIGFSPLINEDVLQESDKNFSYKGYSLSGLSINPFTANVKNKILSRLDNAWKMAAENNVDILFFPETLGTSELIKEDSGFNRHIKDLFFKDDDSRKNPPKVCFLPSHCLNGSNTVTCAYQNGLILGKQNKFKPFIDAKKNAVEFVKDEDVKEILVIHLPNYHRVAMLICSDFLTCDEKTKKELFSRIGTTLLLVPSYSMGEQDFLNALPEFKKYGTTAIWGNCCGATRENRVIGACSIAGIDDIKRFSDEAECDGTCYNNCLFVISLPVDLHQKKPKKNILNNAVKHLINKSKLGESKEE